MEHLLSFNLKIGMVNNMFFTRKDPKTELESLDRAIEILNDRYQKKLITLEQFQAQSLEFGKRREKYLKKLTKSQKEEQ